VISALEHPSIREAALRLARTGWEVTRVSPGADGVVPAAEMIAALRPDTRLAALMLANNELGTLQPVAAVAAVCRSRGIPLLCDAVQAVGKIPVDVDELGADYVTVGAHKFHGPLGAAALWVRKGVEITPYLIGGGQERRRRAGTENVAALAGFGEAAAAAAEELAHRRSYLSSLRDRFEAELPRRVPGAVIHCAGRPRLPNTSHIAVPGVEGESLLIRLDVAGIAVSTGSACSSGTVEPSKTLLAMGLSRDEALSSLRVSFGMMNRPEEVDHALDVLAREWPSCAASRRWRWYDRAGSLGADRRGDERRSRLLGGRLAAGAPGGAGDRPLHAPLGSLGRRGPRPLLRRPRPGGRPAGRAAGGHPTLHAAHGRGVPREGGRSLRGGLPGRPHPEPCVRCNTWIKFDLLLERARRLGAERVATGHYARILRARTVPSCTPRWTRRRTRATTSSS